jgi:transposase
MEFEAQAASMSRTEIASLLKDHQELKQAHEVLAQRLAWFERQLFGAKSERRILDVVRQQLCLGEIASVPTAEAPAVTVGTHQRRRGGGEAHDDQALRFDASVPVEVIYLDQEKDPAEYTLVGEKVICRLAQRPGSYVVLRLIRRAYKRKADGEFSCLPAPPAVFEKSCADVSFLAGLVIDKLLYHLPLYRQHQRLAAAGVHLARATLTNHVHGVGGLLELIHTAQLESILASSTLALDETPIKAGRKKGTPPRPGQMKTGVRVR